MRVQRWSGMRLSARTGVRAECARHPDAEMHLMPILGHADSQRGRDVRGERFASAGRSSTSYGRKLDPGSVAHQFIYVNRYIADVRGVRSALLCAVCG